MSLGCVSSETNDRVSESSILCRSTKVEVRVGYSRLAECGEMIGVKLSRLDRSRQSGIRSRNLKAQAERRGSVHGRKSVKFDVLCHECSGLMRGRRAQVDGIDMFAIAAYGIVTPNKGP